MDYPFYLLDIDENDEIHGVDAIGLVDRPAIEMGWQAFAQHNMQSYNDYPDSAANNAQRALDWAEENGWGSCGTDVGKQRANQLAKKEPISEETISRMASFERHKQNKDVPYSEGCGGLMWDAWGGTSGIEWAQNKLKKIRASAFSFEVQDESEQIMAGALMVANLPIPRVDENGNVFYVMFSPRTIKKIVEKLKTENTKLTFNVNHDDGRKIEAVLVGDFIVSEKMGMQAPTWHKALSDGSWFGFVKIKDKEDFEYAKQNLTGFSIEGIFDQIKYRDMDDEIINEIKNNIHNMKKIEKELGADIASKLKKLIFGEQPEQEEEKEMEQDDKEKEEMGEAVLSDGTIVSWEGELDVGTQLFVVTEEGQIKANDARHELADGSYVTTEGGVVTEIESAATEEVVAEAPVVEEEMAAAFELSEDQRATIVAQVMEAMQPKFAEIEKQLADKFNKVEEINKAMFSMMQELSKQGETKEDKFSKQGQLLSLKERKLAALARLTNK